MFRVLNHCLMIAALIAATGTHWLLLQSVAWTGMLARNLQSSSIRQAVERTFDGRHPCALCRQISKDKQAEKKPEFRADWKRLEFSYAPEKTMFIAPAFFWETSEPDFFPSGLIQVPSVPPPKVLIG